MKSTTRYLEPGFEMTLFQCSFEVVKSDVGVETGPSKVSLYPPIVSRPLCVYFFSGQISQTMWQYVTLASWGNLCLCMKKQVLVPCMSPSPWKSFPTSFDMLLLHLSFSRPLMRCRYYLAFPVSGQMTALALPGCNVSLPVTWSVNSQSSPAGRMRGAGFLGV